MGSLKKDLLFVLVLTLLIAAGYTALFILEQNMGFLSNLGGSLKL